MASEYWFGAEGMITVTAPDGSTDIPAAGLRGLTITPQFEHVELYTGDSVNREAVKRRNFAVEVDIQYLKWNKDLVEWFLGDGSATSSTVVDTSDVPLFDIDATINNVGGDDDIDVTISNCHFPDGVPLFDYQEDEFLARDVTARGDAIDTSDVA